MDNKKLAFTPVREFLSELIEREKERVKEGELDDDKQSPIYNYAVQVKQLVMSDVGCVSPQAKKEIDDGHLDFFALYDDEIDTVTQQQIVIQLATLLNTYRKRCFECSRVEECQLAET